MNKIKIGFELYFIFVFDSENKKVFQSQKVLNSLGQFIKHVMSDIQFVIKETIAVERNYQKYAIDPMTSPMPENIDSKGFYMPVKVQLVCDLNLSDCSLNKTILTFNECFSNDILIPEIETDVIINQKRKQKGFLSNDKNDKNLIFYKYMYPADKESNLPSFEIIFVNVNGKMVYRCDQQSDDLPLLIP